ncbi:MAG: trimethylamine methyltransferase family protein [Dehalobacterium sp.]
MARRGVRVVEESIKSIHKASMVILAQTGIKVHHRETLKIVEKLGIKVLDDRVFFQEDQLMKWVSKAPKLFTIHARNPQYNMTMGGDSTEFAPGYGCPSIVESNGIRRAATYHDYCNFLKLVHQSEFFKINGGLVVQPCDLDPRQFLPLLIYSTIIHSDKCLMGIPGRTLEVLKMMDLVGILFGQNALLEKPRVLTLINSTSPLQYDQVALETMMVCSQHNQPLIVSPGPMAGATGPVTLAGNLALGNAEALAGIAISQMVNEGTPVVYGLQPTIIDMSSAAISIGSPVCALGMAYSAKLAKFYGLPSRCGGANTDAKNVSAQSGLESMMAMFGICLEKPNFILHSAGILDGYGSMSYEQFILDLEIIRMVEYYLKGLNFSQESLAVKIIDQVGPGGEFLTVQHTLDNFREASWMSEICRRGPTTENKTGEDIFNHNIIMKKEKMLEEYRIPNIDLSVKAQLMNYLSTEIEIDKALLKKVG